MITYRPNSALFWSLKRSINCAQGPPPRPRIAIAIFAPLAVLAIYNAEEKEEKKDSTDVGCPKLGDGCKVCPICRGGDGEIVRKMKRMIKMRCEIEEVEITDWMKRKRKPQTNSLKGKD